MKIGDFGHAKELPPSAKSVEKSKRSELKSSAKSKTNTGLSCRFVGTLNYQAPEIIDSQEYDGKVDIWCLGLIVYQVCSKKHPFSQGVKEGNRTYNNRVYEQAHKPIPEVWQYSPELLSLIDRMLAKKPEDRPTAAGIVEEVK